MKNYLLLFLLFYSCIKPVKGVPVIPSFSAGNSTVNVDTTQTIREIQKIYSYSTGYNYSVNGVNIAPINTNQIITPTAIEVNENVVNNVKSTWTGIDLKNKPVWKQVTPGGNTQYVENFTGPGLTSVVDLDRTTTIKSVSSTVSTFSQ